MYLLQRYHRHMQGLLKFILAAGIIEKIVTQPLDDVDTYQVSVDYVYE